MRPADFAAVNPNTGTAPVFRTRRDADLTTAIYARLSVLVDHRVRPPAMPWPVCYHRMFDMTNDSHLFRTQAELTADGWYPVASGRMQRRETKARPLYVGHMFNQFHHRASNVGVNLENLHNAAVSEAVTLADKIDPAFTPEPQYLVEEGNIVSKRQWSLAYRDIARPTDVRTIIAAVLPSASAAYLTKTLDHA